VQQVRPLLRILQMKTTIKSLCAAVLVASAMSAAPVSAKTVAVSLIPYNFVGEAVATKSLKPNKYLAALAKQRGRLKKVRRVKRATGPSSVGSLTTILTAGGGIVGASNDGGLGGPTSGGGDQGTGPRIDDMPPAPVPLPGAAGLMLIGLMALGAAAKARRA
jgi:hypothetical protein